METKVKIHSMVDVITNSSTEVYIMIKQGAEKGVMELLNEILKIGGSDKRAEDLFEVYVDRDWERVSDSFIEEYLTDPYAQSEYPEIVEMANAYVALPNWDEKIVYGGTVIAPWLKEHPEWVDRLTDADSYADMETFLVIKSKDESVSTMEFFSTFINLMDIEASANY